jgi:predicted RNA-binding protein YlxR (DUF448 family)
MPGRGAYVCRDPRSTLARRACVEHALRRRGIARALRAPVTLDAKPVESP